MAEQVVIEQLEFQGRCGVTEAERLVPQPIRVDVVLDYPPGAIGTIARQDDIGEAVDYAAVAQRVIESGTARPFHLLETFAHELAQDLMREFAVERVRLWVRKGGATVKGVEGSVGVRVDRRRSTSAGPRPAAFLRQGLRVLPRGRVLDVAAGAGRNALYLAGLGFSVHAVDRDPAALATLAAEAGRQRPARITTERLDLEADGHSPPDLGCEAYEGVIVFFYLHRPLFPSLLRALKPGGVMIYETFLIDNHLRYHHPRRREFCLEHNELLALTRGLRVLHYDEGDRAAEGGEGTACTARLIGEKDPAGGAP